MKRRALIVLVLAACASVSLAGLHARGTAAAFTTQTVVAASTFTADKLANYFSVVPGALGSGGVDTLSLAFGTVQHAQTFTSVFTVKNVSAQPQTAVLTLTGAPQISSALFAVSGSGTATLAPGASTTVTVTTSALVAGRGAGALRLRLSGTTWIYRDYAVSVAEAPEAPAALTAVAQAAGTIHLAWPASTTITNLAGYDVYRAIGAGAYAKLNASPLAALSYDNVAPSAVDGTAYTYKIEAVSSDASPLASLDSPTSAATADATPPTLTVTYTDNKNPAEDQVVVTTQAGVTVSGIVHTNAFSGTGSFTANVGAFKSQSGTGSATATDSAGNATTISFAWAAAK
jgi:hypothetical protein